MQSKARVRKFGVLGILGIATTASLLSGCTGTYVYSDHGWYRTNWVWVDGHRRPRSHVSIGRSYKAGHARPYRGPAPCPPSGPRSGGSHSSGRSGHR